MLDQLKIGFAILAIGILMTFGLIASAAQNLPANAEAVVTTAQEDPSGREGRRGDRSFDRELEADFIEDILDLD